MFVRSFVRSLVRSLMSYHYGLSFRRMHLPATAGPSPAACTATETAISTSIWRVLAVNAEFLLSTSASIITGSSKHISGAKGWRTCTRVGPRLGKGTHKRRSLNISPPQDWHSRLSARNKFLSYQGFGLNPADFRSSSK